MTKCLMVWRLWLGLVTEPGVAVIAVAWYPHAPQLQFVFWLAMGWVPCFVIEVGRIK